MDEHYQEFDDDLIKKMIGQSKHSRDEFYGATKHTARRRECPSIGHPHQSRHDDPSACPAPMVAGRKNGSGPSEMPYNLVKTLISGTGQRRPLKCRHSWNNAKLRRPLVERRPSAPYDASYTSRNQICLSPNASISI